uniref:Uncharacterized protein n=1 Tax=Romanomermis culicivorax TaxID=13658 RepID=A0A915L083_ROMCU
MPIGVWSNPPAH